MNYLVGTASSDPWIDWLINWLENWTVIGNVFHKPIIFFPESNFFFLFFSNTIFWIDLKEVFFEKFAGPIIMKKMISSAQWVGGFFAGGCDHVRHRHLSAPGVHGLPPHRGAAL